MSARFRFANPPAGDFELPDVAAVLDALEAAAVTPETPMFDTVRQSWQPVGRHPEVRAAWAERARCLPPGAGRPDRPDEEPDGPAEEELRRRAWELVKRGNRLPLAEPAAPERSRRGMVVLAVAALALVVMLLGWGVLTLAGEFSRMGRTLVGAELGR
jgi:hypothetical protein